MTPVARFLALDVGDRRIGVAAGSAEAGLATPLEVLQRRAGDREVFDRLRALLRSERAEAIIVGDPVNMDGSAGPQAESAREFARRLKKALHPVGVELFDERLSSFSADEWMEREGVRPADRKKRRDAYAAAVILMDYFASGRANPANPAPSSE
jgi:putative Holliday junction resolvase